MKAYLIDPEKRLVSAIDLPDKGMLDAMQRLIGCDGMDHITISDEHDQIWVDDLGLTCGRCWAWKLQALRDPLGGRGIIIGADDRGMTRAPFVPLWMIQRDVIWLDEIVPEITWLNEANGCRAVVTYERIDSSKGDNHGL